MRRAVCAVFCLCLVASLAQVTAADAARPPPGQGLLRLNHFQAAGTHNSYHQRPLIPTYLVEPTWDYEHPSLEHQLSSEGIRQLEFDVHWDPNEERFEVFHRRFIDDNTSCRLLTDCLMSIRAWSDANPTHHPVFVLIQPTDTYEEMGSSLPIGFFDYSIVGHYDALDAEIRGALETGRDRLLVPDELQGDAATLQSAILDRGWPALEDIRGQFVFVFLDHNHHLDNYVGRDSLGAPSLAGRVMFVHDSGNYASLRSVFLIDDPTNPAVASRAEQGYIVRVFPESDQYDEALASGAHIISVNSPHPRCEPAGPCLQIPGGNPLRCNPRSAPPSCRADRLEDLSR